MIVFNKNPEYFLTIAREKSISKAAEKLHVSQPYLSQHIRRLEEAMEITLFDRARTPIALTTAGQIYYNYLENSNLLYQKLSADFDDLNAERENTLNLGVGSWRGSSMLPDVLPSFRENNPNAKIFLHEHPISELYALLEDNTIDIAVMNVNWMTHENMTREVIMMEKMLLVANKMHPITKLLQENRAKNMKIDLKVLENECFILLDPGLICGAIINAYFDNNRIFIKNRLFTTNNTTAINLVIENMGFCFMQESGFNRASHEKNLEFFDLGSKDLEIPLAVIYKKYTYFSRTTRNFIDALKDFYSVSKFA
ncbi:MAG: LysR family transcriptional regulator [Synergistaceae bacterium]